MTFSSKLTRRHLFQYGFAGLAAGTTIASPLKGYAAGEDTRFTPRFLGNPQAPYIVEEYFSLTCIHCAHFAKTTFPQVKKDLIDKGQLVYYFHDFPTDQLATVAAMVARSLPVERYVPFCESLLANLDRWAFGKDIKPLDELKKFAVFAGMSNTQFDQVLSDQQLWKFILTDQEKAQKAYKFDATPTFRFNHKQQVSEAVSYDKFVEKLKMK